MASIFDDAIESVRIKKLDMVFSDEALPLSTSRKSATAVSSGETRWGLGW
jgi:hypothetical protein